MQFPESWLREFVTPDISTQELAHRLTMAGLEVEEIQPVAPPFSNVIVAHVLEVNKHPNADRLNICQVNIGQATPIQIVCGAPNVRPGIKVPCALVGASLPPTQAGQSSFDIKQSEIRGVTSHGMLCSAKELHLPEHLSNTAEGLLILPEDAPTGSNIRDYLQLDDALFTLKLTPNRGDCLSILGIAREVAALTQAPLQQAATTPIKNTLQEEWPVHIEIPTGGPNTCGRFTSCVIRNVNAAVPTPPWMVARLERSGHRSVGVLADITNYVMLELGQPLHAYDLQRINGPLQIRLAKSEETLELLNGQKVTLNTSNLIIADQTGPIALAGIMGGASTKVSSETQDVLLEAAFFFPSVIRGRARQLSVASDASHRFERGVDFENTLLGITRATQLILEICGGASGPIQDKRTDSTQAPITLPTRAPITLRLARLKKILGIDISAQHVTEIFDRLKLNYENKNDTFCVTPPSYRFDLEIEEDLIEEVARIYGFEHIPVKPPIAQTQCLPSPEGRLSRHRLRHALAARGYQETIGFSFVDPQWEIDFAGNTQPLRLRNPMSQQISIMRSTLIGNLIQTAQYNLKRKASRLRLFEIGRVFSQKNSTEGPTSSAPIAQATPGSSTQALDPQASNHHQPIHMGLLIYGPIVEEQWGAPSRAADFFDLKGDIETLLLPNTADFIKAEHPALHPERCARIEIGGRTVGWIGELHPKHLPQYDLPHAPILLEIELDVLLQRPIPAYQDISKFPPVYRDIALVVHSTEKAQHIHDALWKACQQDAQAQQYVKQIQLFDVFMMDQNNTSADNVETLRRKSLAFKITLQCHEETLQESVIEKTISHLVNYVTVNCGAQLRTHS